MLYGPLVFILKSKKKPIPSRSLHLFKHPPSPRCQRLFFYLFSLFFFLETDSWIGGTNTNQVFLFLFFLLVLWVDWGFWYLGILFLLWMMLCWINPYELLFLLYGTLPNLRYCINSFDVFKFCFLLKFLCSFCMLAFPLIYFLGVVHFYIFWGFQFCNGHEILQSTGMYNLGSQF